MRTYGALLAGAAIGLVSGAATVLTHTAWGWLALALAAAGGALWAAPRAGRAGLAVGWGVAVARGSVQRPEGDYLISADPQGWTLLGCSLVLVVGGLVSAALGAGRSEDPRLRGTPS